jgi:hypothetical protein
VILFEQTMQFAMHGKKLNSKFLKPKISVIPVLLSYDIPNSI